MHEITESKELFLQFITFISDLVSSPAVLWRLTDYESLIVVLQMDGPYYIATAELYNIKLANSRFINSLQPSSLKADPSR